MRFHSAVFPRRALRVLIVAAAFSGTVSFAKTEKDLAKFAETYCFTCHGAQFSGGRAPAIAGGKWNRAKNDSAAADIILKGMPDVGMPAFVKTLSRGEAEVVVRRIRDTPARNATRESASAAGGSSSVGIRDGNTAGRSFHSEKQNFKVEVVGQGYEVPWSFAFLPDGSILVAERAGRLRIVAQGKNSEPVRGVPKVWYLQDGGLLSIALDPNFGQNGWIYLSYAEPGVKSGTSMTKIVRGHIQDGAWIDQQVVWQADQKFYYSSNEHYGCRLRFVGGKLFFCIGERGNRQAAQDLQNPCGKIHRIDPDGKIPADNPFVNVHQACASIWSYGHRNPQGLAFDSSTGVLWSTEHGPLGGDELNVIQRGGNYGWPVVTFGTEHTGEKISRMTSKVGMVDPIYQWTPSIAVCPVIVSTSDRYPGWKGDLIIGSLAVQQLHRLALKNNRVTQDELLIPNLGRIRDLVTGPDGLLYVAVEYRDRPGEIIRLLPE